MAGGQHTQLTVDLRDQPGHRRLGRTGIAREHQVPGAFGHLHARRPALRVHLHLGGHRPHPLLDRRQTDHAVQLGKQGRQVLALATIPLPHADVLRLGQVGDEELAQLGRVHVRERGEPLGLARDRAFQQLPRRTPVGKTPAPWDEPNPVRQLGNQLLVQGVALGLGDHLEDPGQLLVGVVRELHPVREPGPQAGIGLHELVHQLRVARHDDDQVLAVVLHLHQQFRDRLGAEVGALAVVLHEVVRLVDEQDAAQRVLADLPGLDRGLPEIPGDQVRTLHLDHVPGGDHTQFPVDLADQPGHGGLGRTGIAREHQVPAARGQLEPGLAALAVHVHLGDHRPHPALDRLQADHGVQFGQQLGQFALAATLAHAHTGVGGRGQVLGEQRVQLGRAGVGRGGQPGGLAADAGLQQLAGRAAVGETLAPADPRDAPGQRGDQLRRERVALGLGHQREDAGQFLVAVVRELDPGLEPRAQAGVGVQEGAHLPRVARHDHDQVVPVVLHLHQDLGHRLLAEVALALLLHEVVRLVHEQHPSVRLLHQFAGLGGGLADVLPHQVGATALDELPALQHAQLPVDLREQPGHRGLGRTGVAGEQQVPAALRDRQPRGLAPGVHLQLGDQVAHLLLDRVQADHRVQFGQQLGRGLAARVRRGGLVQRGQVRHVHVQGVRGTAAHDGALAGRLDQRLDPPCPRGGAVRPALEHQVDQSEPGLRADGGPPLGGQHVHQGLHRGGPGQVGQAVHQRALHHGGRGLAQRLVERLGPGQGEHPALGLVVRDLHEQVEQGTRAGHVADQRVHVLDQVDHGLAVVRLAHVHPHLRVHRAVVLLGVGHDLGRGLGPVRVVGEHLARQQGVVQPLGQPVLPGVLRADQQHQRVGLAVAAAGVPHPVRPGDHPRGPLEEGRDGFAGGHEAAAVGQRLHHGLPGRDHRCGLRHGLLLHGLLGLHRLLRLRGAGRGAERGVGGRREGLPLAAAPPPQPGLTWAQGPPGAVRGGEHRLSAQRGLALGLGERIPPRAGHGSPSCCWLRSTSQDTAPAARPWAV